MRRLLTLVLLLSLFGCGGNEESVDPFPVNPETGLRLATLGPVPELPEWADNPTTPAKLKLGQILFSDPRLSGSGRLGCAGCHFQNTWFQSNTPQDVPDRSYPDVSPRLTRNAPSLLNLVYATECRWDGGHCDSLPEVMMLPFAEANMNLTPGIAADDVHTIDVPLAQENFRTRVVTQLPEYVAVFKDAFDVDITTLSAEELWLLGGQAMAILMRYAVSGDADFDRWNAGDANAMTDAQVRGLEVFLGKGRCATCHYGPFFTDYNFHNMSREPVREDGTRADEGRFLITGNEEDRGKFLTPTLRAVAMTAPWFHDGSETSLSALIAHITGPAGKVDPLHDPLLDDIELLNEADTNDLMQFLKALTGKHPDPTLFIVDTSELPSIEESPIGVPPSTP